MLPGCRPAQPTLAGGKPVEHWIKALDDPQPKVRKQAVIKLGNVGTADPKALPALIVAMKDGDAEVRCAAILAVVKLGPAAQETVPQLNEIQKQDRAAKVRACAARALEKLHAHD